MGGGARAGAAGICQYFPLTRILIWQASGARKAGQDLAIEINHYESGE